jgi:hypothetical protein
VINHHAATSAETEAIRVSRDWKRTADPIMGPLEKRLFDAI